MPCVSYICAMAEIFSMTGFGRSTVLIPGKKITVELRSLNSKQFDVNLKVSGAFREMEPDLRKLLAEELVRGKIEASIICEVTGAEQTPAINKPLVMGYLSQLRDVMKESGLEGDILNAVLRFPDVVQAINSELDEEEKTGALRAAREAVEQLQAFRMKEGGELANDLHNRLGSIRKGLEQVPKFEEERKTAMVEKLKRGLEQLDTSYDENRFEQELIYYLEKYDITEEKVRLETHINHFEELLGSGGAIGKKLNFLAQELGREINTIGSKANHAELQRLVVNMKDDLEKIKEQVLNIL